MTTNDNLRGLLRDELAYGGQPVSCQIGLVERCVCENCRTIRIDAALAEPDSGEVVPDPLTEALEHIRDSIEMQVELINIRAPGKYLDKQPIVSALLSHRRRCIKALELNKAPAKAEPGVKS